MTTCKNCLFEFDGKFCSNCGQKADIHRVTVPHVLHEFIHAFTHADKGFLVTAWKLVTRPGYVAKEYLEGKRKTYFNPLSFLVITAAVQTYLTFKTGYFQALTERPPGRMPEFWKDVMSTMVQNQKLFELLILVPIVSFLLFILFRKGKHNYAENFVLTSFIIGELSIFRILIGLPLFLIFSDALMIDNIFRVLMLVYFIAAFYQFFRQNIFITILKSILLMILFIMLYWLAIAGYVYVRNLIIN